MDFIQTENVITLELEIRLKSPEINLSALPHILDFSIIKQDSMSKEAACQEIVNSIYKKS